MEKDEPAQRGSRTKPIPRARGVRLLRVNALTAECLEVTAVAASGMLGMAGANSLLLIKTDVPIKVYVADV